MDRLATYHSGASLVTDLQQFDKLSKSDAQAWIERKTNLPFNPVAQYKLRWRDSNNTSNSWIDKIDLLVHMMSDFEIEEMDRACREFNKQPPRRVWEPSDAIGFGCKEKANKEKNG
jgi:hypothetical protein